MSGDAKGSCWKIIYLVTTQLMDITISHQTKKGYGMETMKYALKIFLYLTTTRLLVQTANDLNIEILPHQPYSPDLAPSDFFLSQNLKIHLKEIILVVMKKLYYLWWLV